MSSVRLRDLPREERQAVMAKVKADLDRSERNRSLEEQAAFRLGWTSVLFFMLKFSAVGIVVGTIIGLAIAYTAGTL